MIQNFPCTERRFRTHAADLYTELLSRLPVRPGNERRQIHCPQFGIGASASPEVHARNAGFSGWCFKIHNPSPFVM